MKQIPLTKGKFAIVDDEDYDFLMIRKWYCRNGYASCKLKRGSVEIVINMHRIINRTPEGLDTDHINGNRLDNRKCNLRNATRSQNGCNREPSISNKTTGYRGVWKRKNRPEDVWCAEIKVNGKRHRLGTFYDIKDAAVAYNEAAIKYHGEFARLNDVV